MKNVLKNFIIRYGHQICSIAIMASAMMVSKCRGLFYQPKEPEGLEEMAKIFYEEKQK